MSTLILSDMNMDLALDGRGYIKINQNEYAINDQIKFLLTTFKGEILFDPLLGNSLEEELWEFQNGTLELSSFLSDLIKQEMPFINPTVNIQTDPNDPRMVIYTVSYTINNDENIGKTYTTQGTI